jgi:DNA-directed RNA polymerase alpha subunit
MTNKDEIILVKKILRKYFNEFKGTVAYFNVLKKIEKYTIEEVGITEPILLGKSVYSLHLSNRLNNAIKRWFRKSSEEITISELLEFTEEGILTMKGFGSKGLQELKENLDKRGLKLLDETAIGQSSNEEMLDRSIISLYMNTRFYNCMKVWFHKHPSLIKISELIELTEDDIYMMRNLGYKSIIELKDKLAKRNLKLKNI